MNKVAIVGGIGTNSDFGLALVRSLAQRDLHVVATTRRAQTVQALEGLAPGVDFRVLDLTDAEAVQRTVAEVEAQIGAVELYVHNAARLVMTSFLDATVEQFHEAWQANVATALPMSRQVLQRMVDRGRGTVIFSGATASLRGGGRFSPFASAKFALRGLAQALAREFGPKGIHVAHVVVDGVIWGARARDDFEMAEDACIGPGDLAQAYVALWDQPRSAWTHELDVRPFSESF